MTKFTSMLGVILAGGQSRRMGQDKLFFSGLMHGCRGLIAATANAADLVREHERGRLHEGSFADLLLVDGNPLDDITMAANRDNHRLVIKNGEVAAGSLGNGNLPT